MKNAGKNELHHDNTSVSIPTPSVYQIYPDVNDGHGPRRRRTPDVTAESPQKTKDVNCNRAKTNLIIFLIAIIVALVAALCYTLILLFEETNDLREPPIEDMPDIDLPPAQSTWYDIGLEELRESVSYKRNHEKAKNVILFMGDGMGVSTVTASRIYKFGEEGLLTWENFPHTGLLKTYCVDKQVCDSASTATALFCGIKSNYETSGVDSSVLLDDCQASLNQSKRVDSILKWAQDANKATGFVTTTRVVHATPSALYSHVPNRRWECESKIKPEDLKKGCKDIAKQLVEDEPGRNINVIMGGGRQCLVSNVDNTPEDPIDTWSCVSKDGRNLIQDWALDKKNRNLRHAVVENNEDLDKLNHKDVEYVMGVFANGHLKYDHERDTGPKGMPSLMNMTEKALQILKRNKNGFLLVVEGGMIDQAHHRGNARRALSEAAALDDAVKRALEIMRSELDDTLVIVTADHSHSLTINGYPKRGNDILGIARESRFDGVPYTTLLYATGGPDSFQIETNDEGKLQRKDPTKEKTTEYTYVQQAAVASDENAHAGSDVSIHATGPGAHLVQRVHEQHYVAHLVSYAARIGRFRGL